ncbi:MAG: type II toxin-antitoxin system VapC family toxin [Pyrinomonadaceae bacterium]
MGLNSPTIYLDSCIAIYLVEEHPAFAPQLESLLDTEQKANLAISDLTILECLIGPLRSGNKQLETKFMNWFDDVFVFPIPIAIFQLAAHLRADHRSLKTPDALHLATALHHRCDEFWTNDDRLDKAAPELVKNIIAHSD